MFLVTFLGHQGWLLSSRETHIMADPLLDDTFGACREAGLFVYPPREINCEKAPAVSALFISHEHEDHFQIASLARIDKRIPLLLSARCSRAARAAAEMMGFTVRCLDAGESVTVGDLELRTLDAPNVTAHDTEWDVLPYVVSHKDGDGSFLSYVDLPPPYDYAAAKAGGRDISLITRANNHTSPHVLNNWQTPPVGAVEVLAELAGELRASGRNAGRPLATVASGGGWSFSGALEHLNRSFFPSDNLSLAEGLRSSWARLEERFLAPLPGETLMLEDGVIRERAPTFHSFLKCRDRAAWPDRRYDARQPRVTTTVPLFAGRQHDGGTLRELRAALRAFARFMAGGSLFMGLTRLGRAELGSHIRRYGLFVQTNDRGEGELLEYDPSAADFVEASREAGDYAAGGMCWAGDLLMVLAGRTTAAALTFGHMVEWVRCPTRSPGDLSIQTDLWRYAHPLTMPEEFLEQYRTSVAALDRPAPVVRSTHV
jgi:hypothetical protein